MKTYNSKTVDTYIKNFPAPIAIRLKQIKKIITEVAPKAEEGISYGLAAYKLNGPLIYFGGFKNHIGLYAFPATNKAFKEKLSKYKTTKGAVQFQHDEPLPLPLIKQVIRYRYRQQTAKNK